MLLPAETDTATGGRKERWCHGPLGDGPHENGGVSVARYLNGTQENQDGRKDR